jgi:hypothetical protein
MFPKRSQAGRQHRPRLKLDRTTGLHALDRKLWRLFSQYIRARDCTSIGWGFCVTCGQAKPIAEMDAGHFVGRRHLATRFDERNVNAQCRRCNRFESGESYAYGKAIDAKYGPGTADNLYTLSRMRGTKLDRLWYETKIEQYTALLKKVQSGG